MHRELIRNLQQWRSLYEAMEVPDTLIAQDGHEYSLWDVQAFYAQRSRCPERQSQSIRYYLYENLREKDAAVRMGISESNPVGIYATIGLTSLLALAVVGELPGYPIDIGRPIVRQEEGVMTRG